MNNLIKEIKADVKNVVFYIAIELGSILALASAFINIRLYYDSVPVNENLSYNMLTPIFSAYTFWIGGGKQNIFSTVLFWLFPVLATLPILNRCKKKLCKPTEQNTNSRSHFIDYFASFTVAGMAVSIPLMINFLSVLLFVPALNPDSVYDIYYGVFSYHAFSDLFYTYPIVYEILYIVCIFIIGGLIGGIAYILLMLFHNKAFVAFIAPILIVLIQLEKLYVGILTTDISLIAFINSSAELFSNIKIVSIETVIMLLFSISFLFIKKYCDNSVQE